MESEFYKKRLQVHAKGRWWWVFSHEENKVIVTLRFEESKGSEDFAFFSDKFHQFKFRIVSYADVKMEEITDFVSRVFCTKDTIS